MAAKTQVEKVTRAAGKRPQSATKIGQKLGYKDHKGVARALKTAVDQGLLVKTEKGYSKT
jgi:hypothetical protein